MPKNITGSGTAQTALDLTAEVPLTGDISSSSRLEETIQGLLNNDAALLARITGAVIRALFTGNERIDTPQIADDAITAAQLSAAAGTTGQYLRLQASNGLAWDTPINVQTGAGLTGGGNEGTITLSIPNNSILADMIRAGAITNAKIADGAVNAAKIVDGVINAAKLGTNAVETAKINAKAVTAAKIADNTITAAQIAPNAVAESELANDSVDENAIKDDAVTTDKIDDDAVTAAKIADGAINTTAKIANGIITNAKLAANTVAADKIAPNAVGASELANNAVDTAAIQTNAVNADKIAANAVGSSELANNAVDTAAIQNNAVNADKINANAVTTAKIQNDAVNAAKIATNAVTSDAIAADAVGASEIAANAVDTSELIADAVDATILDTTNAGTVGQVLQLAASNRLTWVNQSTGGVGGGAGQTLTWNPGNHRFVSGALFTARFTNTFAARIGPLVVISGSVSIDADSSGTRWRQASFRLPLPLANDGNAFKTGDTGVILLETDFDIAARKSSTNTSAGTGTFYAVYTTNA